MPLPPSDQPGSLLPPEFESPSRRPRSVSGSISLWPKTGSIATCAGVFLLWAFLMLSPQASSVGASLLTSAIAPFGVNLPYPLIVTAACLVALASFGWPILVTLSAQVAFDGEALRFADGVFSRENTTWHVSRIETVEVFTPFAGRLLGYGSLRVAAMGGSELWVIGLRDPRRFAQAVLDAQALDARRGAPLRGRGGWAPATPASSASDPGDWR
jgi:hypothetical protein